MGPGISANYDQVSFIFTSGCWKVHSAISKANNERVSLWMIDSQLLSNLIPDQSTQTSYLQGYLNGLQKARKFRHPRILKIIQIQETLSSLAFSSEPVSSCLTTLIGSLEKCDASYIGYQILEGLSFIHDAKTLHLGLTPSAIFLNESLTVKLFNFNWCTPYSPDSGPTQVPFTQFSMDPSLPNVNYIAPEMVVNKTCFPQSDIFSFCCVLFEMLTSHQLRQIRYINEFNPSVDQSSYSLKVSNDYSSLFSQCFQSSPVQRPSASILIQQEPFQTVSIKVLRYLDLIIAKDPKDKFGFFKGLSKVISDFSPMMTKARILPVLIKECKDNQIFAPILLGTIFSVSEKFSVTEFTNEVFKNISYLTNLSDPPHISIAFLQSIHLILEKTDKSLHNDCVYPIIFNAIQSPNEVVQKECLKKLPSIVAKIGDSSVRNVLLPKLVTLASNTSDSSIAASSITTIASCLPRVDNDGFLLELFPKVFKSWKKNSTPAVSESMLNLVTALKASNRNIMSRAMQVAAAVSSSPNCLPYIQKKFCNWMINAIAQFKTANSLDRPIEKPQESELIAMKTSQQQPKPTSSPHSQQNSSPFPSAASFDGGFTSTQKASNNNYNNNYYNNNNYNNNYNFNNNANFGTSNSNPALQNAQNGFDPFSPSNQQQKQQQNDQFSSFQMQSPPQQQQQLPTRQPRVVQGGGLSLGSPTTSIPSKNDDLLNLF